MEKLQNGKDQKEEGGGTDETSAADSKASLQKRRPEPKSSSLFIRFFQLHAPRPQPLHFPGLGGLHFFLFFLARKKSLFLVLDRIV